MLTVSALTNASESSEQPQQTTHQNHADTSNNQPPTQSKNTQHFSTETGNRHHESPSKNDGEGKCIDGNNANKIHLPGGKDSDDFITQSLPIANKKSR